MYAIGLAYRGTSNNGAIQKLLHFAVSDVSDNVRRAAVTCLGFVLMNNPAQVRRAPHRSILKHFGAILFSRILASFTDVPCLHTLKTHVWPQCGAAKGLRPCWQS